MNQGFIYAAARASQAAADAAQASDTRAALRGLDEAVHAQRVVADRVARQQSRRAVARRDSSAMLAAIRATQ